MKKNKVHISEFPSFEETGKQLLQKIKMKDRPDKTEIDSTWEEVKIFIKRDKKRAIVRKLFYYSTTAAALLALLFSFYFLQEPANESNGLSVVLLQDSIPNPQKEIVLIAENREMELTDQSTLQYEKDGTLAVNNHPVTEKKDPANPIEFNHILVPKGRRASITFSDGTKIFINADSHVIYPAVFEKEKREIVVEGEIFLEVSKDPERPFIVKTNGFDVKVLGTTFNVCAYKNEKTSSVVLVEGSVEVKTGTNEKIQLQPNELIDIQPNSTEIKEVDVLEYICWKDNMMLLTQRKVNEVLDRLGRYYGRTILYDPAIREIPISGKLDLKENLQEVIDIICLSVSLKYETRENNEIYVSLK